MYWLKAGLEMDNDFDNFESQITTEIKQQSLDVDIGIGVPLSRTPSLRSTNISTYSDGGRISSLDGKYVKVFEFFFKFIIKFDF